MAVEPEAQSDSQSDTDHPLDVGSSPAADGAPVEEISYRKPLSISLEALKPFYTTCAAFAWIIPIILWGFGLLFICQTLLIYQPAIPLSQSSESAAPESITSADPDISAAQPGRIEVNTIRYWLRLVLLIVLLVVWGLLAGWLYLFLNRRV